MARRTLLSTLAVTVLLLAAMAVAATPTARAVHALHKLAGGSRAGKAGASSRRSFAAKEATPGECWALYQDYVSNLTAACGEGSVDNFWSLADTDNYTSAAVEGAKRTCEPGCMAAWRRETRKLKGPGCNLGVDPAAVESNLGLCRRAGNETCAVAVKALGRADCDDKWNQTSCAAATGRGMWCRWSMEDGRNQCNTRWTQERMQQYCGPCFDVIADVWKATYERLGWSESARYARRSMTAAKGLLCSRQSNEYCVPLISNVYDGPEWDTDNASVPLAQVERTVSQTCTPTMQRCLGAYEGSARTFMKLEAGSQVDDCFENCSGRANVSGCRQNCASDYYRARQQVRGLRADYTCGRNEQGRWCVEATHALRRHGCVGAISSSGQCNATCAAWAGQALVEYGCCSLPLLAQDNAEVPRSDMPAEVAALLPAEKAMVFANHPFAPFVGVCNQTASFAPQAAEIVRLSSRACPARRSAWRALRLRAVSWAPLEGNAERLAALARKVAQDVSSLTGARPEQVNGTVQADPGLAKLREYAPARGEGGDVDDRDDRDDRNDRENVTMPASEQPSGPAPPPMGSSRRADGENAPAGNVPVVFVFTVSGSSENAVDAMLRNFDQAANAGTLELPATATFIEQNCEGCHAGTTDSRAIVGSANPRGRCEEPSAAAAMLMPAWSTCPTYTACGAALCGCVGSTQATNATTCLAMASPAQTCTSVGRCLRTYMNCVLDITAQRSDSASACQPLGASLYLQELAATLGNYEGSVLQEACRSRTCRILNASTTLSRCDLGANDSDVCRERASAVPVPNVTAPAPNGTAAPGSPATPPASTLPADFVEALRATIRISGTAFAALLNDPTRRAELVAAVTTDLARLLAVVEEFVRILNMYEGSLVVDFAVDAAAGVAPATLTANLQSMSTNPNWLSSIQSVYSTVSNETLTATVESVATAAPGTVTTQPPSGDISGAASFTTAVAAVSALAALVLAF